MLLHALSVEGDAHRRGDAARTRRRHARVAARAAAPAPRARHHARAAQRQLDPDEKRRLLEESQRLLHERQRENCDPAGPTSAGPAGIDRRCCAEPRSSPMPPSSPRTSETATPRTAQRKPNGAAHAARAELRQGAQRATPAQRRSLDPPGDARARDRAPPGRAGAPPGLRHARGAERDARARGRGRRDAQRDPRDRRRAPDPRGADAPPARRPAPGRRTPSRRRAHQRSGARLPARDGPGLAADARGRGRDRPAHRDRASTIRSARSSAPPSACARCSRSPRS